MKRWKERTGGETLQSKKGRINVPEEERRRITKRDQGWKKSKHIGHDREDDEVTVKDC